MDKLVGNEEKKAMILKMAEKVANREVDPYTMSNDLVNKVILKKT